MISRMPGFRWYLEGEGQLGRAREGVTNIPPKTLAVTMTTLPAWERAGELGSTEGYQSRYVVLVNCELVTKKSSGRADKSNAISLVE